MDNENAVMAFRKTERDIELAIGDCKSAHTKLLEILNEAYSESEIDWIRRIQTRYSETIEKINFHRHDRKQKQHQTKLCTLHGKS